MQPLVFWTGSMMNEADGALALNLPATEPVVGADGPGVAEPDSAAPTVPETTSDPQSARADAVEAIPHAEPPAIEPERVSPWARIGREIVSGIQTLVSAAVYATLIVTFGFQ